MVLDLSGWSLVIGILSPIVLGAIWVGRISQRVTGHDTVLKHIDKKLTEIETTAKTTQAQAQTTAQLAHASAQETSRALGRIEGRLDNLPNE